MVDGLGLSSFPGRLTVCSLPGTFWEFEKSLVQARGRGKTFLLCLEKEAGLFEKVLAACPWEAEKDDTNEEAFLLWAGRRKGPGELALGQLFRRDILGGGLAEAVMESRAGKEPIVTWIDLNGWVHTEWMGRLRLYKEMSDIFALTYMCSRFKGATHEDLYGNFKGNQKKWIIHHLGAPDEWVRYFDTAGMVHAVWRKR